MTTQHWYLPSAGRKASQYPSGVVYQIPNVLVVHEWALDKTQCNCPNCDSWSMVGNVLYSLHALPIQNFFCKSPSPTHKVNSLFRSAEHLPSIHYFMKQSLGFILANWVLASVGWVFGYQRNTLLQLGVPVLWKTAPVNQHPPVRAPSTGCLLWLSCGWSSTQLLPSFILVTHSVRSRSNNIDR
jgi:hypothetical protein